MLLCRLIAALRRHLSLAFEEGGSHARAHSAFRCLQNGGLRWSWPSGELGQARRFDCQHWVCRGKRGRLPGWLCRIADRLCRWLAGFLRSGCRLHRFLGRGLRFFSVRYCRRFGLTASTFTFVPDPDVRVAGHGIAERWWLHLAEGRCDKVKRRCVESLRAGLGALVFAVLFLPRVRFVALPVVDDDAGGR